MKKQTVPEPTPASAFVSQSVMALRARLTGSLKGRSLAYYASGSLMCQALRFLGVILSTRMLLPEDFGVFAQALVVVCLACALRDPGLSNAMIAYGGQDPRYARFHFQATLVGSLASGGLTVAVAHYWPGLAVGVREASSWLGILVVLEGLGLTGTIMAQRQFRFKALAAIETLSVGSWVAVLALGPHFAHGFWLLLWARLVESTVRGIALGVLETRRHIGLVWGRDLLSYYGGFARYGSLLTILETFANQIDGILLSAFGGLYHLGLYDRMQQFTRIPLSLSINLIDRVALVSFSQHQNEPARLRGLLRSFAGLAFGSAAGVILVTTLILPWLLQWSVGGAWTARLLPLWGAAILLMAVRPVVWCINLFMQGTGKLRLLFHLMVIGVVTLSGLGLALVPTFGASGMLWAQGLTYLLLLGFQVLVLRRYFSESNSQHQTGSPVTPPSF